MATKQIEEAEEQRRARYQATRHRESVAAITAAEAILLPLGFTRRKEKEYFNFNEPGRVEAEWNLADPQISAHISTQAKGWAHETGDGSLYYRLVVRARNVWHLRDARIAPGNRPALLAQIEKIKQALADNAAYDRKLEKMVKDARAMLSKQFPNLKIVQIEADHDDLIAVRVQTKTGGSFHLSLGGNLNFMGLTVSEDGTASKPIGRSLARALGAL